MVGIVPKIFKILFILLGSILSLGAIGGFFSGDYFSASIMFFIGLAILFISLRNQIINFIMNMRAEIACMGKEQKHRQKEVEKRHEEHRKQEAKKRTVKNKNISYQKQEKWFSGWALFFWIIFFWPGAIIYMIIKSSNRYR